jgi:hypothetical protein
VETIIERLRAHKMAHLIRKIESVDKEKALNYDNETLTHGSSSLSKRFQLSRGFPLKSSSKLRTQMSPASSRANSLTALLPCFGVVGQAVI